ncbi:MAG: hypothetical protein ABIR54_11890 [Burkholderiaceae bacterium]
MYKRPWLILVALLSIAPATWAAFKPIRVLAPEWVGMTCEGRVCVEEPARLHAAQALYADALAFVDARVGAVAAPPRIAFCSTLACSRRFGFTSQGAYTVGTSGIAISYRGWQPYFVRHELIHHLQNERLGSVRAGFFKPAWWREGMAYSLSEDPRRPLTPSLEVLRASYETWEKALHGRDVWQAAATL